MINMSETKSERRTRRAVERAERQLRDAEPLDVRLHRAACRLAADIALSRVASGEIGLEYVGDALHDAQIEVFDSAAYVMAVETATANADGETALMMLLAEIRDERARRQPSLIN